MNADTRAYLNWYRRLVFSIPFMSDEECVKCAQNRDAGNAHFYAQKLASRHLALVYLAYHRINVEKEVLQDIFQLGYLLLLRCAMSWRYRDSATFRTYASKSLMKFLPRALQIAGGPAVGTVRSQAKVALIRKIQSHYQARGIELPAREVASLAACSSKLMHASLNTERQGSLDAPRRHRGSTRFDGVLASEETDQMAPSHLSEIADLDVASPEEVALNEELISRMEGYLGSDLSERQRIVLTARFNLGMKNPDALTLSDTGKLLQLSRERTRQIEREAITKLHELLLPLVNAPEPLIDD